MEIPLSQQGEASEIFLPSTWFESRITLEQIRYCFSKGIKEIRIASGFFTLNSDLAPRKVDMRMNS